VASPFGCRSGHISAFAEATLPRDGQVGEGVSPALDAQTEEHNDPRRSTYSLQRRVSNRASSRESTLGRSEGDRRGWQTGFDEAGRNGYATTCRSDNDGRQIRVFQPPIDLKIPVSQS
jgi:hypothetical protein